MIRHRGLGAMMAVELAKEGVKLCLVARSPKLLEVVAADCRAVSERR